MIVRRHSNARLSQVVEYPLSGTRVVLAGITADNAAAGVEEQTREVLAKIDMLLAEAGTDKSQVTHAYVWLRDIADFAAMNTVYDAWVSPGNLPARACVEAHLADPRLRVEIQVFAIKS